MKRFLDRLALCVFYALIVFSVVVVIGSIVALVFATIDNWRVGCIAWGAIAIVSLIVWASSRLRDME